MAIKSTFKITFNPNFLREATALGTALLPKVTQQIKSAIVRRSPVQFGVNRRSIEAFRVNDFLWKIASMSGYGGYLNFGTRRMAPRPYFNAGVEYMAGQISKVTDARQLDAPLPDPGTPMMFGAAAKAV